MSKSKQAAKRLSWMSRLRRLPQSAEREFTRQFHRIPQRTRFFLVSALFSIITTLAASHYPVSILPRYQVGDVATIDVIVPATLMVEDAARPRGEAPRFKRNPVLVYAGERVTPETAPLIEAVREYQLSQRSLPHLLGLLIFVGFIFYAIYKSSTTSRTSRLGPRTAYWVAGSALMMQTVITRAGMFGAAVLGSRPETSGIGGFFEFQFAIPYAASALFLSMLIGGQVALLVSLMSALLVALTSPYGISIAAFAVAGSVAATYSVQRYRTRNAVTNASAVVGAVNVLMCIAVALIADHPWSWGMLWGSALLGLVGAVLTAAGAGLAIPVYESFFDILTDMKLMELANADNPLLRQLAIQTPGTSHHSFMVGLLAHEAAKEIGANALLARTGCLYHDIGKLAAPKMYIENQQGGPNPHDKVSPLDSVRIITGHVRRGIQMAVEHDLPPQIIDFIPQHHGTRILAYFYHKAKSQAEARGETVNMDEFRYPGPKPQTKESVILMLADGAEASVRSLDDPSPENIRAIVKKIVESVVADGQLEESDVTMRELTLIRESLIHTLINVYHQRISYPGFNPSDEAGNQAEEEMTKAGKSVAATTNTP